MFTNNIDAIDAAFYILDKKEDRINYYYEPRFTKKKEEDWKRSYIINELRKDFIRDINNYGFSPFIESTFNEQRKDNNIMKYFNLNNYDFSEYIKKMNIVIHHKPKLDRLQLQNEINNSVQNKISKANLFYNRLKSHKKRSLFNLSRHNLSTKNKTPKVKKLTQIVKFNRKENNDVQKNQYMKSNNNNNELESSFNYEDKNGSKSFYENRSKDKSNTKSFKIYEQGQILNKKNEDEIIIHDKFEDFGKKNLYYNKIKSYTKQLINDKATSNKNIKIRKIKIKNEKPNFLFEKRFLRNNYPKVIALDSSSTKNKTFSIGKTGKSFNYYLNDKKDVKKKKYLYLEKLEKFSGGIFKSAKKYYYPTKIKKK